MRLRLPFLDGSPGTGCLVGVLHVPRLLEPGRGAELGRLLDRVLTDARAYAAAGFDALLLENFGDAPFDAERAEPHVLTLLTTLGVALQRTTELSFGVNVLRNDAGGALAVALATGGAFVRVNVLAGVVATDQGLIEGRAADVARYRERLHADIAVWADVDVKHGSPLWGAGIASRATDLAERAGADALIVTGVATGAGAETDDVETVRRACPQVPVLVGSGVDETHLEAASRAHGVIVASSVKTDGVREAPVDVERATRLADVLRAAWSARG